MKKRILVTGGNGFVGREVTKQLYKDHNVCVLDNLRTGPLRFAPGEAKNFTLAEIDIADGGNVSRLMSDFKPDIIIHLAAIHYIPECEDDPALAVRTNIEGSINLLRYSPRKSRFVFTSSGAVYYPDDKPHNETTARLGPSDVYGLSKLHGEQYATYFTSQRELSTIIVRLFNVVGPGETNPHVLPEIIAQLKAGRKTLRLGNMWPKRDYIHVRDAARGFVAVALGSEVDAGTVLTVNLGTSQSFSVEEIIAKLKRVAPVNFSLELDPSRQRKIDRPHLAADIDAIRCRFGWSPEATIDEALADLWREPDLGPILTAKYQ
jgi:UDP-glucose 4-epimerase